MTDNIEESNDIKEITEWRIIGTGKTPGQPPGKPSRYGASEDRLAMMQAYDDASADKNEAEDANNFSIIKECDASQTQARSKRTYEWNAT